MAASSYLLVVLVPPALVVLASPLLVSGESCGAVTHAEPGDDFASLMAKTIANFEANCRGKKKHENNVISWPVGLYGLPMPTSGCPTDSGFEWETGSRFHDTENFKSLNEWSEGLRLKGPWGENDVSKHFCMKTVDRVADTNPVWPSGQYCIFKYGQNCPNDLSSGSIFYDDENKRNTNSVSGTVPSGVYDQDTLIHFCCMTDGDASAPITLPSHSPFYLFPYTAQCQEVQGMRVTREWFQQDDEDDTNAGYASGTYPYYYFNGGFVTMYYCYYSQI